MFQYSTVVQEREQCSYKMLKYCIYLGDKSVRMVFCPRDAGGESACGPAARGSGPLCPRLSPRGKLRSRSVPSAARAAASCTGGCWPVTARCFEHRCCTAAWRTAGVGGAAGARPPYWSPRAPPLPNFGRRPSSRGGPRRNRFSSARGGGAACSRSCPRLACGGSAGLAGGPGRRPRRSPRTEASPRRVTSGPVICNVHIWRANFENIRYRHLLMLAITCMCERVNIVGENVCSNPVTPCLTDGTPVQTYVESFIYHFWTVFYILSRNG